MSDQEIDAMKFRLRAETLQREVERLIEVIQDQRKKIEDLEISNRTMRRRVESFEIEIEKARGVCG